MPKKLRILFDSDIFNRQKYGGISWYITEIIKGLQKKTNITLPVILSENLYLKEKKLGYKILNSIFYTSITPKVLIKKAPFRLNSIYTKFLLKRNNFDVFVPTYFDTDFLEIIKNKPFVLTVYDMVHEKLPHYFQDDIYTVPQKLKLMERATRIIAISHNTKNDIIEIYPHIDPAKIEVVHLSQSIVTDDKIRIDLPKKYILFVGSRAMYKNFICLYNAAKSLLLNDPDLYIVCAGSYEFTREEIELYESDGIKDKIIHKHFEVNELFYFYKNAICFVFPSEYEGFGIPVLESMACGCPVILPNISSFPEVAGEAGIYFDLHDIKSLESKLIEILENDVLRDEYIEKGYKQVEKFSWERAANLCFEIFKKAADNE